MAGPVGRIGSEVGSEMAGKVCLEAIAVERDLSAIQLGVGVSGNVDMNGNIKVTPLNLGHLVCIAPTNFPLDFTLKVPPSVQALKSKLTFEKREEQFGLAFTTNDLTFPVRLTPSPTEWIVSNLDMTIKCPVANLLKPVIIQATPFVPELKGVTAYNQKAVEGFIKLKIPSERIGSQEIALFVSANEKALIVAGK